MYITEEAIKRANSNLDYIQNARDLENILRAKYLNLKTKCFIQLFSNRVKSEELDHYIEYINKASTIKSFTEGENSNEFYQETNQKMVAIYYQWSLYK